ncbi:hypothetical protein pipiens_018346, partial [Culex pipiens pipiens]
KPSSRFDFLEAFREFEHLPRCVQFQLEYAIFVRVEITLNFIVLCRGRKVLNMRIGASPCHALEETANLFPAGSRFHLRQNCSPFAAVGYRFELDLQNCWL